ncbi:MAG: hypothetical protein V1846_01730 [Candidatus Komeilibacteria bacterium]
MKGKHIAFVAEILVALTLIYYVVDQKIYTKYVKIYGHEETASAQVTVNYTAPHNSIIPVPRYHPASFETEFTTNDGLKFTVDSKEIYDQFKERKSAVVVYRSVSEEKYRHGEYVRTKQLKPELLSAR